LADLIVREVGKPRREAVAEVSRSAAILRFYAQAALDPDGETYPSSDGSSWLFARRRPHGVVALITPWNFPLAIPIWKIAPALAWGNVVILKPAREAIGVALELERLFETSVGVARIVTTGIEGAEALVGDPRIGALSFTGSASAGRRLSRSVGDRGLPFQAEMGGSNASIVLPDADPELAAAAVAEAAMAFAGQKCTATSRVIVVGRNDRFRDALIEAVVGLRCGDPDDKATVVGPVISSVAVERVMAGADDAIRRGASVLCGGLRGDDPGYFVAPTLIQLTDCESDLATEEYFGPIAGLFNTRDVEQAVTLANATSFGLVTSVFTNDLERAMAVVSLLETGLVRVNAPTTGVDFHAPFGGDKGSSIGPREQGRAAREFYTTSTTVTVRARL
jgi:aldehyde dehydrogenase (NAD+)